MHGPHSELPVIAGDVLARLRARRPRVHCITNTVAQAFTANVLLAAGAVPSMTVDAEEIGDFVASADALLVNLGTLDSERRHAVAAALDHAAGKPWVLDPVFIDRTARRAAYARTLTNASPRAIRCNRAEFEALAGADADGVADYAHERGIVIGLTGATDIVSDGARQVAIANGDAMMARITALGCAASALVAAALAAERDAFFATAAALIWIGVAGEMAAKQAAGPGSLTVGILDTLARLDADTLIAHARVT